MIERFQEIASVRGVKGYVVISAADGSLLGTSLQADEESARERTAQLMHEAADSPEPVSHVTINVPGGRVLAMHAGELFVAIYVAPRFDVGELRVKLRQIEKKELELSHELQRELRLDDLSTLHWAVKAITEPIMAELGTFVVVNALKKHLTALLADYPCLRTFDVTKDGRIEAQTTPSCAVSVAVIGVTSWIARFVGHCGGIVAKFNADFMRETLRERQAQLEKIGFYSALEQLEDAGETQ